MVYGSVSKTMVRGSVCRTESGSFSETSGPSTNHLKQDLGRMLDVKEVQHTLTSQVSVWLNMPHSADAIKVLLLYMIVFRGSIHSSGYCPKQAFCQDFQFGGVKAKLGD